MESWMMDQIHPWILSNNSDAYLSDLPFIDLGQILTKIGKYYPITIQPPELIGCQLTFDIFYDYFINIDYIKEQILKRLRQKSKNNIFNNFLESHIKEEKKRTKFRKANSMPLIYSGGLDQKKILLV